MATITLGLTAAGPTVNVVLLPSAPRQAALKAANLQLPPPTSGQFLIDTGASNTAVDSTLIAPLGLVPTGAIMCHTPSTGSKAVPFNQYDVMFIVPGANTNDIPWIVEALPVMETDFSAHGIHGLIGRDMLDKAIFIYNGSAGNFTLAY